MLCAYKKSKHGESHEMGQANQRQQISLNSISFITSTNRELSSNEFFKPEAVVVVVKAIADPPTDVPELAAAGVEHVSVDEGCRKLGEHAHGARDNCKGKGLLQMINVLLYVCITIKCV